MDKHDIAGTVSGACFLICLVLVMVAVLTGCVQHEVRAPQLDAALEKIQSLTPPVQCRKADVPPLPNRILIDIDGDQINRLDAGGETVLRAYAVCRSAAVP